MEVQNKKKKHSKKRIQKIF
nr:ribosomal protein L32 [Hypericum monogynum]